MPVCDLANASQAVIDARLSQWRIQQLPQILERHIRMFQTYLCDLSETVRQRTKSSGLFDPLDIFHLSDSRTDCLYDIRRLFFKHVLDEDAYERKRLQVYHFLVDAAKDGFVFPATIPGTQKLGEERSQALQEVISEDGIIVEKYRDRKLLERYLESVALKYDMTLAELSLLLYRKDAGKALTRGAEAQMPAREDAVEATDRKDAGKALSRKDLAELMHMSRGDLRAALQKLVSRGMLEVVDVPRKRREAAEIAEATGLFGKRGEAQDADANGMTKKKREPRMIRLELLPASDAVLQDIAAAERDYEQAKFRGFTEDELRQYTALERRVQENEKQILQK